MSTDKESQFAIEIAEKIGYLDFNRPQEANRLTRAMITELAGEIRKLGEHDDVNLIAIRNRGDIFCGGRDGRGETAAALTPYQVRKQMMGPVLSVYEALMAVPVPVVACVHADAIGFGAAVVGGCDIAVASAAAKFSFPEIAHNIAPTMAMSSVIRKLPPAVLSYLIYSGESITAAEALQCGLIGKIYPAEDFAHACAAFLAKLAAHPRPVLETIKKYQNGAVGMSAAQSFDYAGTLLTLVRQEK